MADALVSGHSNQAPDDDVLAIPEGRDPAIVIEARRRGTLYHLDDYLSERSSSFEDNSTSLSRYESIADEARRHKVALDVSHDLLETDLTMLAGQLNQVLQIRKRTGRDFPALLATYGSNPSYEELIVVGKLIRVEQVNLLSNCCGFHSLA